MDARTNDIDTLRADFYLCLARAFQSPADPSFCTALRDDLPDDLAELAAGIGYDCASEIADFRRRIAVLDPPGLLQVHSRLFLQPPRAVHINTGAYLDGGFNGGSVREMEAWYRACGLAQAENFRDLADHVSVQLEFVAYLYAHALAEEHLPYTAGQFIGRFVARWVSPWCDDLAQAERELSMPDEPYLPLACILRKAALHDAESLNDLDPALARREKALMRARHKQSVKGVTDDDLAEIRRRLDERGLATDHLAIPFDQRDAARGWRPGTPPSPRK